MESFKEWLYAQLVGDEIIGEDDYDMDELDELTLLSETDLEQDDLENYKAEFEQHCASIGSQPDWDLD